MTVQGVILRACVLVAFVIAGHYWGSGEGSVILQGVILRAGVLVVFVIGGHCLGEWSGGRGECNCPRCNTTC